MKNLKRIVLVFLVIALSSISFSVQAQRRGSKRRTPARASRSQLADSRLTGTYRLDSARGDDARLAAERATSKLSERDRQRVFDNVMARLESPDMIAIEQSGRNVSIASSSAPRITFDADGQERSESVGNGRTMRTRATLSGNRLDVTATGDRSNDFNVTFESLNNGQRLGVTRRIYANQLDQPIVVRSFYDKNSNLAQWNVYGGDTYGGTQTSQGDYGTETNATNFVIPDGMQLVAVLNNDLSTKESRDNDRFTLTVREPASYAGATIDGYISGIKQSGRITGRSQMTLNFERIKLRNGRTYRFAGIVDSARASNGETIRVDNEGSVEGSNQTTKTGVRAAIGTGVGAIIGAIAGGGKGAAIGAAVGAGAGAGSVYVQGRENLELASGTLLTISSSQPGNDR